MLMDLGSLLLIFFFFQNEISDALKLTCHCIIANKNSIVASIANFSVDVLIRVLTCYLSCRPSIIL